MGNKQSTADLIADIKRDHPQSGRAAVATGTTTPPPAVDSSPPSATGATAPDLSSLFSQRPLTVTGYRDDQCPIPAALISAIAAGMSQPKFHQEWCMMYDSAYDGKSFSRVVKILGASSNSTLLIVQERSEPGQEPGPHCRCFGGFNAMEWKTTAQRDKEGKTAGAAKQRAARLGQSDAGSQIDDKPADQLPQFFGNDECFVFTSGEPKRSGEATTTQPPNGAAALGGRPDASAGGTEEAEPATAAVSAEDDGYVVDPSQIRIYRPKGSNSNFMYLFDLHPQQERIGIGMGGAKDEGSASVGNFAFFVDRFLNHGTCSIRLCPTFGNPRLSTEGSFSVGRVWILGVIPFDSQATTDRAGEDGGHQSDSDSCGGSREVADRHKRLGIKRSCIFNRDAVVDKMLLELNGTHSFKGEYDREGNCGE